jgi:hypothetical protein
MGYVYVPGDQQENTLKTVTDGCGFSSFIREFI